MTDLRCSARVSVSCTGELHPVPVFRALWGGVHIFAGPDRTLFVSVRVQQVPGYRKKSRMCWNLL